MGIVDDNSFVHHNTKYDLNRKIMITALISISIVVFLVTILRLSIRCLIIRSQAQDQATSRNSRISAMTNASQVVPRSKNGLHPSLITSLPIFLYKKNDPYDDIIECSICLSIIEDGELVRVLPNCKHNFHVECIDKWFNCHSTCPICRTTPTEGVVSHMTPSMAPMDGEETSSSSESGASSRLSSFKRVILSKKRSSQRLQVESCSREDHVDDLESGGSRI